MCKKLRREADGFAATVQGNRPYRVALHRGTAGPEFSCNCPYAFDGICKHMMALDLAVLDAYGSELTSPNPAPAAASPLADRALAAAIKAAWSDRRKGDKLRFLKQALAKNDDLTRQFLGFGQPAAAPTDPLADLPARLTDTLGVLDFDEDFWENSESFYEDDGLQEAADELLRDTLAAARHPGALRRRAAALGGADSLRWPYATGPRPAGPSPNSKSRPATPLGCLATTEPTCCTSGTRC